MLDERTVNLLDEIARRMNPSVKEVAYSPITKIIKIYPEQGKSKKLDTQDLTAVDILVRFAELVKEVN